MKDFFHIHTYRCGHTDGSADEDYIKKAIELGGDNIWFTDHAPFPGNPFGNRMKYEDLDEYILSLKKLKSKYSNRINVKIGLEIEYFPSYDDYYKTLKSMNIFDCLMLGQHMYEVIPNQYSFSLSKERLQKEECYGLASAIMMGMNTGYFNVLAHPDRVFRRIEVWNDDMAELVKEIINSAKENDVILERNLSSKKDSKYYDKFWAIVPEDVNTIVGYDAHNVDDLRIYK